MTQDTSESKTLDGSRYHYVDLGYPGTFAVANNVRFPSAPDPKEVGLGQPYGGDDNVTKTWSGRLLHDFGSDWHATAGILQQDSDRASTVPTNTLTNNTGAYTATAATTTFSLDRLLSNRFALDGHLVTGPFTHDLLLANTGFNWVRYSPYQTGAITLGKANLADPVIFPEPVFPDFQSRYKALVTRQQSVMLGDTIGWGDQWSLGVIESESWIKVRNLSKTGTTTSRYDDSGISSNATLSYKPQTNMTVYVSYADSLQQGDIAPAGTINAGTGLAPYRSKQDELGYKVELGRLDLVADVFRIRRPYAVVAANVFEVQGEQVNDGLELSARGAVTDDLTVFGGATYLDPVVTHTGVPSTDDKQVLGLSERSVLAVCCSTTASQRCRVLRPVCMSPTTRAVTETMPTPIG